MKCIRCGSLRLIRFVDGFGAHRIFCKSCKGSFPENYSTFAAHQKHLQDFVKLIHDNPRAVL